jgi:hypothetical protein
VVGGTKTSTYARGNAIIVPRDSIAALPQTKTSTAICGPDMQQPRERSMFPKRKTLVFSPVATTKEGLIMFDATRDGSITESPVGCILALRVCDENALVELESRNEST